MIAVPMLAVNSTGYHHSLPILPAVFKKLPTLAGALATHAIFENTASHYYLHFEILIVTHCWFIESGRGGWGFNFMAIVLTSLMC